MMDSFSAAEFAVAMFLVVALNAIVATLLVRRTRARALRDFAAEREALQAEIDKLRAGSAARSPEPAEAAKTPYTRAAEMARSGAAIATIVDECGITRGEAELIVALHRSGISSS